jgi:hypothetical protein
MVHLAAGKACEARRVAQVARLRGHKMGCRFARCRCAVVAGRAASGANGWVTGGAQEAREAGVAGRAVGCGRDMVRRLAGRSDPVMAACAVSGDARVTEGCAREAHIAPVACDAIGYGCDVIGRFRDRTNAEEGLTIMAGAAAGDDAAVIHSRIGEGHCVSVAGIACGSPGWDVIRRLSRGHRPIVTSNTRARRPLQPAIDVAAHALNEGVSARQRKTGLEMIESGRALLRQHGTGKKQQSQGKYASEQSVLVHLSLALSGSASSEKPNALGKAAKRATQCLAVFCEIDSAEPLPLCVNAIAETGSNSPRRLEPVSRCNNGIG